uniref:Uncharacterized protein n=1 Tax=Leersia perrieri TaxID=77586 RepID=A0A0D9WCM5_9ORYZ
MARRGAVDIVAGDDDQAVVCVEKVAKIGRRRREANGGGDVAMDRVEEIGGKGVDIWAQIFIEQMRQKMNSQYFSTNNR